MIHYNPTSHREHRANASGRVPARKERKQVIWVIAEEARSNEKERAGDRNMSRLGGCAVAANVNHYEKSHVGVGISGEGARRWRSTRCDGSYFTKWMSLFCLEMT